jgi:SRSO17 transposase
MDGDWQGDLERWLEPYLSALGNKTRRQMCPAYIAGLIGPGDRKSIQPMAARVDDVSYDRLYHFIGAGIWDSAPLEATLWQQAGELVGGDRAWLIIDDTALPKKGKASVGVAPQYATALGKNANCQTLVSVTGFGRSAGHAELAAVPAGKLDQRSSADGQGQRARALPELSHEARDRH